MSDIVTSSDAPDPAPPSKPKRRWGLIAVVVTVVVALGGAGATVAALDHRADVRAEKKAEADRAAAEKAEAERLAAEEERLAREAAALAEREQIYGDCLDHLEDLYDALDIVDARLNVGISQADLSGLVGDASVAYNRVDIDDLAETGGPCLSAGAKLESALKAYSTSASRWNDCIYDYGCDVDSIDPFLQGKWAAAGRSIAKAEQLMDRLDPANDSGSDQDQT